MRSFQVDHIASQLILLSSLCLPTTAAPSADPNKQWTFAEIPPSKNLAWYPCLEKYSCAMLEVPLDYLAPKGHSAAVPLIRVAALENSPNGTYQGMMLVNPGGPGVSGVDYVLESDTQFLLPVIGTNYDIVGFDPRGLGHSIPAANCSASSTGLPGLRRRAFGLHGPELSTLYWESSWKQAKELGRQCEAAIGGPNAAGPHMSTAVVARDMVSIVDAFAATERGKRAKYSSLVNYWGISYGSYIGETFASLYPDRVGRVALDGVADPRDYSAGRSLSDINYDDAVMNSFFVYCHAAGPELCSFYTGTTIEDISSRFENLFVPLNASHAAAQNWANATLISQSLALIKANLRYNLYTPSSGFPSISQQLVAYETVLRNLTLDGIQAATQLGVNTTVVAGTQDELQEWLPGVLCGETPSLYNQTYADLSSTIRALESQSFVAGENWATIGVLCTGWPIRASWSFTGPFGGDTKNPILFVSNTLDPATPMINGQTWSPLFKGSELLVIEGVGHTSIAFSNACANAKLAHFFQTGQLPGNDSFCPVEEGAFGVTVKGLKSNGLL